MKFHLKGSISLFAAALTLAGLVQTAKAADSNAYLYIAHAAGGRNVSSTSNPGFPLDLSIAGVCVARSVVYGDVLGPYLVPAGLLTIKVSPASISSPCGNAAIFTSNGNFGPFSYLGALTFDASNALRLDAAFVDLSAIPAGSGRIMFLNSSAQDLAAILTISGGSSTTVTVHAGLAVANNAPAGLYTGTVTAPGSSLIQAGPALIPVSSRNLYLYVLAGSTAKQAVQLFGPKIVSGVF
jgi:hypothetical protein